MALAVVSDIHGNLSALDAVIADIERRGIDRVCHGGDLVLIGARPAEVLDRIRELGWPGIVGNTDELLWRPEELEVQLRAAPRLAELLRLLFHVYAPATRALLGPRRLDSLKQLPEQLRIDDCVVVHATPDSLWRAPMPDADDDELLVAYQSLEAARVVYGHIHRPYSRRLDGLTVVNCGSVGLPWDGDPRASYVTLDGPGIEIVRVAYDVEREAAILLESGYPDAERIAEMVRSGRFVRVA